MNPEFTIQHTPQQNSMRERKNGTIAEMVGCILEKKKDFQTVSRQNLSKCAVTILNLPPIKAV